MTNKEFSIFYDRMCELYNLGIIPLSMGAEIIKDSVDFYYNSETLFTIKDFSIRKLDPVKKEIEEQIKLLKLLNLWDFK